MKEKISFPEFVKASAISAGFKKSGKKDMALIKITGTKAVGVFTRNKMRSYNVEWTRKAVRFISGGDAYLLVLSGNANACTGKRGMLSVERAASLLYRNPQEAMRNGFLFLTTGVIGVPLDDKMVANGIRRLTHLLNEGAYASPEDVAQAISTTDRWKKIFYREKDGKPFLVSVAKGAGMISPSMATMLSFSFLNAYPKGFNVEKSFKRIVDITFNSISVDGDMSTNDSVLLFYRVPGSDTNSSVEVINKSHFESLLLESFEKLSEEIVKDGEGATLLARVEVHADSKKKARKIAEAISSSLLLKAALAGKDPNWGRIAAAIGKVNFRIDPWKVSIYINNVPVFLKGEPTGRKVAIEGEEVRIRVEAGKTKDVWVFKTCDIGVPYIKFNSGYTT